MFFISYKKPCNDLGKMISVHIQWLTLSYIYM